MQILDRLLLHRHIQRLGGIQALIGVGIIGWGFVKEIDPLIVAGMALLAVNVVLLIMQRSRRNQAEDAVALQFGPVEVGKPRSIAESNVFVESWNGAPVVFNLLNPQGSPRARDVRPTVEVRDLDGNVLAGPTNARWANPQPPNTEEVERDIPANGAPVAIDTVIQEVAGDKFWLVTDEGLRVGLKANTEAIKETDFEVIVTVQGENVPPISKAAGVSLGFPRPVVQGTVTTPNREFGRRDDFGELAQRCHMLAGRVERWVEGFNRGHSERAERMVEEWLAADPATDPAEARRKAYAHDEKNWETDYRLKYEAEAKQLFTEAWELGEIAKEHEQLAVRPLAIQFEEVSKLFDEIAESLYAEVA
jgi:uncharacterized protein YeaO (DUF488 family)